MVNIVNICFITDTNYAVPTGVAIESLIENCKKDTMYNIYIIAVDVGEKIILKWKTYIPVFQLICIRIPIFDFT